MTLYANEDDKLHFSRPINKSDESSTNFASQHFSVDNKSAHPAILIPGDFTLVSIASHLGISLCVPQLGANKETAREAIAYL